MKSKQQETSLPRSKYCPMNSENTFNLCSSQKLETISHLYQTMGKTNTLHVSIMLKLQVAYQ